MGVLDTTYTFTATDVVTSAKLNNVIDQTTFTSSAIATGNVTLAVTTSGQLKVNTSGITANELADNSVNTAKLESYTSGSTGVTTAKIADSAVTTIKIADANVTQAKLASNVVGNGPLARASTSSNQSITANVATKVTLVEGNDTNNNFNSSSFTCSVAGYYMINGSVSAISGVTFLDPSIRINGSSFTPIKGNLSNAIGYRSTVADVLYLNASDYIELWVSGASNFTLTSGTLSVAMIRSA